MHGPIVVGVNRPGRSADGVALAAELCESLNVGLVAAHVPQGEYPFTPFDQHHQRHMQALAKDVRDEMATLIEAVPKTRRRELRVHHASTPAAGLHELATAERAGLIVVGSSHHSPIGRVLAGSTGAALLLDSPCPIAVAPNGFAHRPWTRVGVAIDGCRASEAALDRARELAASLGIELTAYSVATRHGAAPHPDGIEHVMLEGHTVKALSKASEELDLLVVGCRETGGIAGHPTVGSVSRRLVGTAACPLIIVPESLGVDRDEASVPAGGGST